MKEIAALYEPLIERDLERIPSAVREFRQSHSSEDLFLAVARFAVLSYAPSQHSKHALLATLSAHELRDDYGDRWDDLLTECARYAAESRQPWSEPPMLDPPPIDADRPHDIEALRAAVAARDRLAAEQWLAARLDDDDLSRDLFTVASDDFEDLGHKLIVTAAALKLSAILGEKGRYAALRVAVWEMASYGGGPQDPHPALRATFSRKRERVLNSRTDLLQRLVDNAVAEKGSIESVHAVFLYYAAKDTPVFERVCDYLDELESEDPAAEGGGAPLTGGAPLSTVKEPPVYRLARDYGQCLGAFAIRDERLIAAAAYNLEHGSSFADWSFA